MNETEKKIMKICWTVESQVYKFWGCEFALNLFRHRYRTFSKIIVQVSDRSIYNLFTCLQRAICPFKCQFSYRLV